MLKSERRGDKWRVVDESGRIAKNTRTGKPIDGGGHRDPEKAQRQAQHVNESLARKGQL